MKEILCTSTDCPQSLGESRSWGWDRKTCREESHETQLFLRHPPLSALRSLPYTQSPGMTEEPGNRKGN